MISSKRQSDLAWNIATHDRLARKYERMHGEIYNVFEQNRLKNELAVAIAQVETDSKQKVVLDFGCGAGNLTRHLSNLQCEVIASDISTGFLQLVASRTYSQKVVTIQLNGVDLSNIADESVDMVATYSVLHHVPDYLAILSEFMRVLKPGGVVYIDHEPSEAYWAGNLVYEEFKKEMNSKIPRNFKKYLILTNYYDWLIRRFVNPRYHREGDIHVFDDDHIEWKKVITSLENLGGKVLVSKPYLLFKRQYCQVTFNKYCEKVSDMHLLVMRKNYKELKNSV
jgi:ubiquinone/menaquinone biosynthesis C-methylase UbiE